MLAEATGVSYGAAYAIITEKLDKRRLCALLVPHDLTPNQKRYRMEACGHFIDPTFPERIVTGDESWCLTYDPESPKSKKVKCEKSRIKIMLITLFDAGGIIHKEYLPEGTTLNAATYVNILNRLLKRIRRVRPQYTENGSLCSCTIMQATRAP